MFRKNLKTKSVKKSGKWKKCAAVFSFGLVMLGGGLVTGCGECEHSWKLVSTITNATCTQDGSGEYSCSKCNTTKTDTIAKLGHDCEGSEWLTVYNARCEEEGKEKRMCKRNNCNGYEERAIPVLGHDFSDDQWFVSKDKTCTEDGEEYNECDRHTCHYKQTRAIPAGHDFSTYWSYNDTKHWHHANCGHDVKQDEGEHYLAENASIQFNDVKHWFTCDGCNAYIEVYHNLDANKKCTDCDYIRNYTEGLELELNYSRTEYYVVGLGTAQGTDIVIPSSYNGIPITAVYDSFFNEATNITSLVVPNSVTKSSIYLNNLTKLESATIPSSSYNGYPESLKTLTLTKSVPQSSLQGVTTIENIILSEGVTQIPNTAFKGCTGLKNIVISDSIESIGESAFEGCTALQNITITNGVVTIGNNAFKDCTALETVSIGNGVTTLGDYMFKGCTALETVVLGDKVTTLGNYIFEGCAELQTVTLPQSLTTISIAAFKNCVKLTNINLNNVTVFKSGSFTGCKSITDFAFSSNLQVIESSAFLGCEGLVNVTLPGTLTKIDSYAFSNCINLKNVVFEDNNNEISLNNVFAYQKGTSSDKFILDKLVLPKKLKQFVNNSYYNYTFFKDIYYPSNIVGWCEAEISHVYSDTSKLFINNVYVENIDLEGVTTVKTGSFAKSKQIKTIDLGSTLTTIESGAFYECRALASIISDNNCKLTEIKQGTFEYCTALTELNIPDSVTKICESAFQYCTGLKSVTANATSNLKELERNVWANCNSIETMTIPASLIKINDSFGFYTAFSNSDSVTTKVYYLGTVDQWSQMDLSGRDANPAGIVKEFYVGGELLVNAVISDDVEEIKSYTFDNIKKLQSIKIGKNVKKLGYGAIYCLKNLTTVTFAEGCELEIIDEYNFASTGLTSIVLPNKVTRIGGACFKDCASLTSVTLPASLQYIGQQVFRNSSNVSITFNNTEGWYYCNGTSIDRIVGTEQNVGTKAWLDIYLAQSYWLVNKTLIEAAAQ